MSYEKTYTIHTNIDERNLVEEITGKDFQEFSHGVETTATRAKRKSFHATPTFQRSIDTTTTE